MPRLMKISLYIVVLVIITLATGYFTVKLLNADRIVIVPDLRGKGIVAANIILKERGLHIHFEGEDYDLHIPPGHIIRQDTTPGVGVKKGRKIGVIISKGRMFEYVPNIVGRPIDEVRIMLGEKGMRINRIIYVHSDKVAKDIVIAQRPEPEEKTTGSFSIIVSLGGR
ncbi:PASTA domain-containing protein [Thermodesulfovibrionales bacterium]|nr:PASTA domain-containing protein [Thermodesulfovibrionales bacterium]